MASKELSILLTAKDLASKTIGQVSTSISRLGKTGQGLRTIGAGLGTAFVRGTALAIGAIGSLTALVAESVKEGQQAASVQAIYAKAIANSGKVSASYVGILNAQQTALMNLGGVDDELIKTEQTRLIQMGLTGKQVAELTPLILDMSKATGKDLLTSTIAVGKAVNGNVGGLARFGVQIDKAKAKADPFAATMEGLRSKFAGTTKALSGSLEVRLSALREGLANIREEAGIKLLPALTHIVDVVGKALVPAFQKFIDRVMPDVTGLIDDFASALEGGGAERAINGIADALGSMIDLLKIAAGPVKTIVSAFMSLPKEVQGILVGGFALNKLSGGMIGQGLGQIAGGFLQRGGTPANPLFVADVTGGLGKGAASAANIPGAAAAGGSTAAGVIKTAGIIALPLLFGKIAQEILNPKGETGGAMGGPIVPGPGGVMKVDVTRIVETPFNRDQLAALRAIEGKNFSPRITVPVTVNAKLSVRDSVIQTRVVARYGKIGAGDAYGTEHGGGI